MRKILCISLAVLLAVGCTKEELKKQEVVHNPDFIASFEKGGTKVYVDDNLETLWTADDRVSIFTSTYNNQYRFNGKTGDDNGSFSEVESSFYTGKRLQTNYAVYPYSSETSITASGVISLTLPAIQKYAENTYGPGANVMVAATENSSSKYLEFRYLGGVLEIKLYGEGIVKSLSLRGYNGEKIAGAATATVVYNQAPNVIVSEEGTERITIDCGDGVELGKTAETATSFWFVVPPVTFSHGFKVIVKDTEGGIMVGKLSSSFTIERAVKHPMRATEAEFEKIETVEFDNENFKAYCVENFDTDEDEEISYSEAAAVTRIDCAGIDISSLGGIEHFTSLKYLDCRLIGLTSLDLSNNTELDTLYCDINGVTTLDMSNNPKLKFLSCEFSWLTSLNVSKNAELKYLNCSCSKLESLDVSNNTALEYLDCGISELSSLDVSKNIALKHLFCDYNNLTTLTMGNNTALIRLWCSNNGLTTLDVDKCTALETFICYGNELTTLDVSKNAALKELWCYDNLLESLDVSGNTAIQDLRCSPMSTLLKLYVASGQTIPGVTVDRSTDKVPSSTKIVVVEEQ